MMWMPASGMVDNSAQMKDIGFSLGTEIKKLNLNVSASYNNNKSADEPTGNLDSASSKEILQILKSMHEQGKTVILITHDNGIAAQARRVVRIMDGKIESDFINKNYGKEEYIKNQLDA